jgi:hypothetical protein
MEIKRRLYKRASSFETTVPMPLLFAIDKTKKYNIIFKFDKEENKWYIEFEQMKQV